VYDRVRDAGIVAIPISNPNRLSGLTELNDALAFGKPVVITRSPYLPIDVEKIGCGRSVEPGDVVGWVEALRSLRDPQTRADMGAAGKRFAEDRWNYDSFCDAIDATISEALG
jgi:glycosyltransferase involved in cell wall biosynthesis